MTCILPPRQLAVNSVYVLIFLGRKNIFGNQETILSQRNKYLFCSTQTKLINYRNFFKGTIREDFKIKNSKINEIWQKEGRCQEKVKF